MVLLEVFTSIVPMIAWSLESTRNVNSDICCIQFIQLQFQLALQPSLPAVLFLRVWQFWRRRLEKIRKRHLSILRKASQLLCKTTPPATHATDFHNWLLVKSITVSWYVIVSGRFTGGFRGAHPPFFRPKFGSKGKKKNCFLRPDSPLNSGSRWPPLSEGLDLPLIAQFLELYVSEFFVNN